MTPQAAGDKARRWRRFGRYRDSPRRLFEILTPYKQLRRFRPSLYGVSPCQCCTEVTPDEGIVRKSDVTRPWGQNGYSPPKEIC